MITRIVSMHFAPTGRRTFLEIFTSSCDQIRAFPGCLQLELLRTTGDDAHFMTLSRWESEEALQKYRQSELFKSTWARTRVLFDEKPQAWSLQTMVPPVNAI